MYNFQPNESIIMKQKMLFSDELILTNLHIVLVGSKGVFVQTKVIHTFPLSQIKVFNGQAQVFLEKTGSGYQLDVYFFNGQERFQFKDRKEALKWNANINKMITGNEVEIDTSPNMALPGTDYIAETLKETLDTFKETL